MPVIDGKRMVFELSDTPFYETPDRYKANAAHYINLAKTYLPEQWRSIHRGVWNHCHPPLSTIPPQGWKIHLSATPYNARAVLSAAVPALVDMQVAFKFAADRTILSHMTSKNWGRGASGKFITAYPKDDGEFREIIEQLYTVTKGYIGPYILSDRRYKDSAVVHYRYGGLQKTQMLNEQGALKAYILKPSGERVADERAPVYQTPAWLDDPFPQKTQSEGEAGTLKEGRYLIKKALQFKNSGGVYIATDRLYDREVLIKEARAWIGGSTAESDAVALLKKEYRILKIMGGTGYAPVAYDLFQDWENWFLVEEYIDGKDLNKLAQSQSILLRNRCDENDIRNFHRTFCKIFLRISHIVAEFHQRGITLCDLSANNVLISEDLERITFIDFEAACQPGIDVLTGLRTPGYTPLDQNEQTKAEFTRDYYAFAAMMLAFAFPVNLFFRLIPDRIPQIVEELFADASFPEEITQAVVAALSANPEHRPTASEMHAKLKSTNWDHAVTTSRPVPLPTRSHIDTTIDGLGSFIESHADISRDDRLFPCDYRAFGTNPLSLGCGAYGTLFSLHRAGLPINPAWRDWALRHSITNEHYTPGFLMGQAGIAWALIELQDTEQASTLLLQARSHSLFDRSHGLFEGQAGWAFSALRLFLETHDQQFLDASASVVDEILSHAQTDATRGLYWPYTDGQVHLGLGYGASGIALVLLYLGLLTKRERYIEAGLRALRYDISHGQDKQDGHGTRSWSYIADKPFATLPYYMYGAAGIGSVLLRYQQLAGIDEFDTALEDIYVATDCKYSLGFGKVMGLAGIAGFRLDAYHYTSQERHLAAVAKLLKGMDMFRVQREEGFAYPSGTSIDRISCDFGYGIGGILALLARLRQWTPDELTLDRYFIDDRQTMSNNIHVDLLHVAAHAGA